MTGEPVRRRILGAARRIRRMAAGLRLRYTLVAALLAAAACCAGGAVALGFYHESLVANVEHSALGTAATIAAGLKGAAPPVPIPMPVAQGVPRVQILDAAGKVLSGDPSSVEDPPFAAPIPAGAANQRVTSVVGSPWLPEHRAALAAARVTGPSGAITVLVAESLDTADERTRQAIELTAVTGAASVAMVAAVAWLAVGHTLRRVDRLRARVCAIAAGGDLDQRVPQSGTDELARLGATLNDLLADLAAASRRQRRFVADAAHELRTPIAGLNASIEVAARHPGTAYAPSWIGELREGHRRLGRLVDDLLMLAGLDEHAPHRRDPVDLSGLASDAARRRTPPGIRIHAGPIARATVLGDETQLDRTITNLVDNAVRHARHTVSVKLQTENGHAVLSVSDDGPGVPPPDRERIWERFTRLDDARSRHRGGTGLGLALVKELTEAHGGTTYVTDADEGGALFSLRIPLHR